MPMVIRALIDEDYHKTHYDWIDPASTATPSPHNDHAYMFQYCEDMGEFGMEDVIEI